MNLPFYTCKKTWQHLRPVIGERLRAITDACVFSNGALVRQLEQEIRARTGARHAVAVGNGTDALILMLQAAGLWRPDEVLVPVFTFVASASSIVHAGATPVFVDIDPVTYNLDPSDLEACGGTARADRSAGLASVNRSAR
jgi:dTDP-4-amino-4,6-dideoxygalactose transaminase